MLLVGLTGNIASGKSTVADMLVRRGATLIDADVLAREALAAGSPGLEAVKRRWGPAVIAEDGSLDRAHLRQIVFSNDADREALNAIVHPAVEERRAVLVEEARARGARIVVCDIPLLYEKDLAARFDIVVLVDAPRSLRLERLVDERGLSTADANAMMDAQMSADAKRKRADYVLDNAGKHGELEKKVDDLWAKLVRDAERRESR